jgi:hypothetical protein
MDGRLQNAISAIKTGDKTRAQQQLVDYLQANPRDDVGWLWMAAALDDPDRKRDCLNKVLEINPENQVARQGLDRLETPVEVPSLASIVAEPTSTESPQLATDPPTQGNKKHPSQRRRSQLWMIPVIFFGSMVMICVLAVAISMVLDSGTGEIEHSSEPAPPGIIEAFEQGEFCRRFSCKLDTSWDLKSGGTNYSYDISMGPPVMVEVEMKNGQLVGGGLMFMQPRPELDINDLELAYSFLEALQPGTAVDNSIRVYVTQKAEIPVFQICEVEPITFGSTEVRAGRVGPEQVVSVGPCE